MVLEQGFREESLVNITFEEGFSNVSFYEVLNPGACVLHSIVVTSLPKEMVLRLVDTQNALLRTGAHIYREFKDDQGECIFTHMVVCEAILTNTEGVLTVHGDKTVPTNPEQSPAGNYNWDQWIK
jgi:hypothetical protein